MKTPIMIAIMDKIQISSRGPMICEIIHEDIAITVLKFPVIIRKPVISAPSSYQNIVKHSSISIETT